MRWMAFITAVTGLSLMAFGLWGLQAPLKVGEIVQAAQARIVKFTLTSARDVRTSLQQDRDFIPVTIEEKYSKYLYCMTTAEPCPGFSLESRRSYYDDLRQQMTMELNAYYEFIRTNPLKIQASDQKFAIVVLNESTPEIQTAALKIINLFPNSAESLDAVANVVEKTTDASVLDIGLQILSKYQSDPRYNSRIAFALTEQIRQGGSDLTSVAAARRLFPFLNQRNIQAFKMLRNELSPLGSAFDSRAERFRTLDLTLREYERDRLLNH